MNDFQVHNRVRFLRKLVRSICSSIFLIIALICSSQTIRACLNPVGRDEVGKQIYLDGLSAEEFLTQLLTHEGKKYWTDTLKELQQQQRGPPYLFDQNNIAVAMVHLGQIKKAIEVLEKYEKSNPGVYETAANLGTAYELDGQNQKALKWITEGVRRNAQGHYGTEWLHVKILETKIAIKNDTAWLKKHSVLEDIDLNQANAEISVADDLRIKRSLADIEAALVYQLHERLEFVKPQEAIVAELLYDLAHIFSKTRSTEHSAVVQALALKYGPPNERRTAAAIPDSNSTAPVPDQLDSDPAKATPGYSTWTFVGLTVLAVLIASFFVLLRRQLF